MDKTVENFYLKNPEREDYYSNYVSSHMPRCIWVMERFGMDKVINKRILGIGDGPGMNLSLLNKNNYLVNMDGAKLDKKLCHFLNLRVDFNRPDFGMLFDNEEKFDYIIACELIEHVSNINNLMREMKNLLKINSHAIFTIPHESVWHPTSIPGLFFPHENFKQYIEQWAFIVEDFDIYQQGWKTVCYKVRNAPIQESRPKYFKEEVKFLNSYPDDWPNL